MGVKIRAHCLACCSFPPRCPQGAQELEGFPDTVWEPLHFSVGNQGAGTCPHRATHGVMIGTRTESCLCSDQGRVCFPNTVPAPTPTPSQAVWVAIALRVAQSNAGGRDGCVLGRRPPKRGGAAFKGRTARSPDPRRKPSVFSRS